MLHRCYHLRNWRCEPSGLEGLSVCAAMGYEIVFRLHRSITTNPSLEDWSDCEKRGCGCCWPSLRGERQTHRAGNSLMQFRQGQSCPETPAWKTPRTLLAVRLLSPIASWPISQTLGSPSHLLWPLRLSQRVTTPKPPTSLDLGRERVPPAPGRQLQCHR